MGSAVIPARAVAAWLAALPVVAMLAACSEAAVPPGVTRTTKTDVRELHPAAGALALPLKAGSVRFAVIGDSGRGDRAQNEVAQQMVAWRERFPFDFVIMLGDNIYGPHTAQDFVKKFEEPDRPLLEAGVTFHAAIGNHDEPTEINYDKFNMGGERYYTFRRSEHRLQGLAGAGVRFFVLDSRSFDPEQLAWLRTELAGSGTAWKIRYFHHPLYTNGRYTAGARSLRSVPSRSSSRETWMSCSRGTSIFTSAPSRGTASRTSCPGGAGSLRRGDIRPSPLLAKGFDTDFHFMLMEISGDELYFQAVSRTGETVDAGVIKRTQNPEPVNP